MFETTDQPIVAGVGHYLPPRQVGNDELPTSLGCESEEVFKITGIRTRHYADTGVYTSDLAVAACKEAVASAGIELAEVDCIVAATMSPDHHCPGIGVYVQTKLGVDSIPAYDLRNQCSGFLYSLNVASSFLRSGTYRTVLLVCAELQSHALGKGERHRGISPLFGDGAAAVVLKMSEVERPLGAVEYVRVYSDGSGARSLRHRIWDISVDPFNDWSQVAEAPEEIWFGEMDGQVIFRKAVQKMRAAARDALKSSGLELDDVHWVLPHQANGNISTTLCDVMGIPKERLLSNIDRVGNTTSASIPLLLSEGFEAGRFRRDERILMVAFGAGFTWGASLLRVL